MEIIVIVRSSSRIKSNGAQPFHLTLRMLALQSKRTTRKFPGTMLVVVELVVMTKQLKPTIVGMLVWWSNKHSQECYSSGLSGPLRLRVQSLSRKRLRTAAAIAFLCRVWLRGGFRQYSTSIARLSFLGGLEQGS